MGFVTVFYLDAFLLLSLYFLNLKAFFDRDRTCGSTDQNCIYTVQQLDSSDLRDVGQCCCKR